MERPIWKGYIAFGLVNIPITLYSAEKKLDLHFKLIDSRNNARIRYVRVNEETGKEVPWNDVVKGYEYNDNDYVLLSEKELKEISEENSKTINIETFIPKESLDFVNFEKPYYLVPNKGGEKGYVILRDTLKNTKKIGIAKVVIHTRQYLTALIPYKNALLLDLLRYAEEIKQPQDFDLPKETPKSYKISEKEMQIAQQLVNSMATKWNPNDYQDEFRLLLQKWLEEKKGKQKIHKKTSDKKKGVVAKGNVVDFMSLLKKSLENKTHAKKTIHKKTAHRK